MIVFDRLKDGKKNALTLSYDDGRNHDRRLVEIMNKNGIRGTFHLNSGILDGESFITSNEIAQLYENHEVSCHGVRHRTLSSLPVHNIVQEILDDRRALEKASGGIVRGMSYANGIYSDEIINTIKQCGIVYSRTTQNTQNFRLPCDFMKWNPTCHHKDCIEAGKRFLDSFNGYFAYPRLLYIWGHSYEFDRENNWNLIVEFCQMMSGNDDIWYATNIEIYEYISAQKQLIISADNKIIHNPTATQVWFTNDGELQTIMPGETLHIG